MISAKVTIPDFKKLFFTDDFAKKLHAGEKKALSLFGRSVRQKARRRIKKAKRLPLAAMSQQERNAYKNQQRRAKALGKPGPQRPLQASLPGESPRNRTGKLRQHIYYGLEPERNNVIIGPAWLPSSEGNGAEKLEKGGRIKRRAARPGNKIGRGGIVRMKGTEPVYGKLRTGRQVAAADKFDSLLFGPAKTGDVNLLARPYMNPSFEETKPQIPQIFTSIL